MNTFVSFVLERFKFDSRMNENHTVAAGLTFSAQLLSLLSACFDTLLPKRLHFSDFGIPSKTEFKFYKLISRLNLVILNLLLSMLTRPLYCEHRLIKKIFIFFSEHSLSVPRSRNQPFRAQAQTVSTQPLCSFRSR